ncbi:MAG TPA: hypothetical protein VGM90_40065 [Kofleriaceae bacterium]
MTPTALSATHDYDSEYAALPPLAVGVASAWSYAENVQWRWALAGIVVAACGDNHHVDSGYGKNVAQPAELTCEDLCTRMSDCAVALCDEDTASIRYKSVEDVLTDQCIATCSDQRLATFSETQTRCVFALSCRKVFDDDDCNIDGNYTCN